MSPVAQYNLTIKQHENCISILGCPTVYMIFLSPAILTRKQVFSVLEHSSTLKASMHIELLPAELFCFQVSLSCLCSPSEKWTWRFEPRCWRPSRVHRPASPRPSTDTAESENCSSTTENQYLEPSTCTQMKYSIALLKSTWHTYMCVWVIVQASAGVKIIARRLIVLIR